MVNEYPAGWVKTVQNLDFLVVYNSGHLVPYNVPAQALDLVTRFISNQEYGDVVIPVVFDPSVLDNGDGHDNDSTWRADKKKHSSSFGGSHHAILSGLLGFVLGAAMVYVCLQRRRHYGYEAVDTAPEGDKA